MGFGSANTMARIGAMIAPFVINVVGIFLVHHTVRSMIAPFVINVVGIFLVHYTVRSMIAPLLLMW